MVETDTKSLDNDVMSIHPPLAGRSQQLRKCETIIARSKRLRLAEAKALLTIRNKRLYLPHFESFQDYCRRRWGMGLAHAKRLCGWAEVVKNVAPIGAVPERESHARPLSFLTPEQQRTAWAEYLAHAGSVHSARAIQQVCVRVQMSSAGSAAVDVPSISRRERIVPPISWYGSKVALAPRIVSLMPPHETYVEVFAGSAAVLFAKPPSRIEIINDRDGDVVNLFRVLRDLASAERLRELLRLTPYSRDEHDWCRRNPVAEDSVEQARRFVVRCRQSYAGALDDAWSFGIEHNRATDFRRPVDQIDRIIERLRHVQIENGDFRTLLGRCDREGVLLYLDPPYLPTQRSRAEVYPHDLSGDDHMDLLDTLTGMKHAKVILSGYRSPLYDRRLRGWNRYEIGRATNSAAPSLLDRAKARRVETIWTNYRPV